MISTCPHVAKRKCACFVSRDTLAIVSSLWSRLKHGGQEAPQAREELRTRILRLWEDQCKAFEEASEVDADVVDGVLPAEGLDVSEDAVLNGMVYCEDCAIWLNGPKQMDEHLIGKPHKKQLKNSILFPGAKRQQDKNGKEYKQGPPAEQSINSEVDGCSFSLSVSASQAKASGKSPQPAPDYSIGVDDRGEHRNSAPAFDYSTSVNDGSVHCISTPPSSVSQYLPYGMCPWGVYGVAGACPQEYAYYGGCFQ